MIDREHPALDLSAMDRCDRCGAQAIVVAGHEEHATDLLFCVHHIRDHKDSLRDKGWKLTLDVPMAEAAGYRDEEEILV